MSTDEKPSSLVSPKATRYIKLGEGGAWERECIEKGILRFGAEGTRGDRLGLCQRGDWAALAASFVSGGKARSTATRWANETRHFFEDDGTTLWITFVGIRLFWGFLDGPPQRHPEGAGVYSLVKGGWRSVDANGVDLTVDRLPGSLTQLTAYRGTSCNVRMADYVVRRINGERIPQVERGVAAYSDAKAAALALIQLLDWKDFETLVDLIFSTSGWRRVGVVGKAQKTLDLDVILPSTGERALVQVKSTSTSRELAEYLAALSDAGPFDRLIYVHHSGAVETDDERALVIGPERVAELALDAGLMKWLIDKAS